MILLSLQRMPKGKAPFIAKQILWPIYFVSAGCLSYVTVFQQKWVSEFIMRYKSFFLPSLYDDVHFALAHANGSASFISAKQLEMPASSGHVYSWLVGNLSANECQIL